MSEPNMDVPVSPREVLCHAANFHGSLVFIAPSGIGPIAGDDLEMVLQDAGLLLRLGIRVKVVGYQKNSFWGGLELPDKDMFLLLKDESSLVPAASADAASKLCLVSGTDRIVTARGSLDDVPLTDAERLLAEDASLTSQSRRALELAASACRAGVPRVHFFNAHRYGALLQELFTDKGGGTMVYAGTPHKVVRPMVAADRFAVYEVLRSLLGKGTAQYVRDFRKELWVFDLDGDVHGSVRITMFANERLLVRTLAYSARVNAAEVLELLLRESIDQARAKGIRTVVIPTEEIPPLMRIQIWFIRLGFAKGRIPWGPGQVDAWVKDV